jgi:hypothetical protein
LSIDASANIERNYLQAIKAFCEYTGKMLNDFILKPTEINENRSGGPSDNYESLQLNQKILFSESYN